MKNSNALHTFFKFYYEYHFYIIFEEKTDIRLKFQSAQKFANELKEPLIICQ